MADARISFYRRLNRPPGEYSLARRRQDLLHDKKWKLLMRRGRLFRHVPFAHAALAAGSMALGNVRDASDFDVLVVARSGRIFTARFFSILSFGVRGWRRTKLSHNEMAADKICLNHFVTREKMRLDPPHNIYWEELYRHLVPLYGAPDTVNAFFAANDWMSPPRVYRDDLRHLWRAPSGLRRALEGMLSGAAGDRLEKFLKRLQVRRIERGLAASAGHNPRIRYGDTELEFHPDTRRIDQFIGS